MHNLVDKRTVLVTLRHVLLEWSDMPKWRDDQIIKAIKELPFVQAKQPITCKDCKHRYVDGDGVRYNVCELNHNKVQSDDWFCADAERKKEVKREIQNQ